MPRIIMIRDWEFRHTANFIACYKAGREYLVTTRCADAAVEESAAYRKSDERGTAQT